MTLISSLRSRIFLTSALLAVLSIGIAIYVVNVRVTRETEVQLRRQAHETAAIVESFRSIRSDTFTAHARLVADLPKLKSAVDTDDPLTVDDIAKDYRRQLKASLVVVTNAHGRILADLGADPETAALVAQQPGLRAALAGHEGSSLVPRPDGILQVVTVPIAIGRSSPEMLGTLSVGFLLDDALARQLKQITGSEVAFAMGGRVLASTLPPEDRPALSELLRTSRVSHVRLAGEDFMAFPQPLTRSGDDGREGGPVALILRSSTEQLRFLDAIHTALGVTAVVAVALAIVLSFAVARTITRPLAAITDVMRDVAATGDLTRKISREGSPWADADAQLLAATFNTLTDSIARFQREMSLKERLSSLGRMSTVVAHEIRNPLMIIKAALHSLRRPDVTADAMREAIADIDEEIVRLNRIVNEVLDFARPIRFELASVDLNALCRESAAASEASGPGAPVTLDLDPALGTVTTDPERLRQALVNMLVNARHAVAAVPQAERAAAAGNGGVATAVVTDAAPLITLKTAVEGNRVSIVIADRGVGINPADLPRVFDPYFTTKRGGSGLGLAISKNVVEGLGGTIAVASTRGIGTEIRLDFPQSMAI